MYHLCSNCCRQPLACDLPKPPFTHPPSDVCQRCCLCVGLVWLLLLPPFIPLLTARTLQPSCITKSRPLLVMSCTVFIHFCVWPLPFIFTVAAQGGILLLLVGAMQTMLENWTCSYQYKDMKRTWLTFYGRLICTTTGADASGPGTGKNQYW